MSDYYEIHVTYGTGDSDGYTIVAKGEYEDDAINNALRDGLFEEQADVDNIDYVSEISEEEYEELHK